MWTLVSNEGRAETMRDCFREAALKARYHSVWDRFSSHTFSLVDCAAQISRNKGIISGALVSTRPGLIMNGGPGNNSRAHRCSLKLKRELHRFSRGVLGPSARISQPPAWRSDPRQPQDWSTITHKSEAGGNIWDLYLALMNDLQPSLKSLDDLPARSPMACRVDGQTTAYFCIDFQLILTYVLQLVKIISIHSEASHTQTHTQLK